MAIGHNMPSIGYAAHTTLGLLPFLSALVFFCIDCIYLIRIGYELRIGCAATRTPSGSRRSPMRPQECRQAVSLRLKRVALDEEEVGCSRRRSIHIYLYVTCEYSILYIYIYNTPSYTLFKYSILCIVIYANIALGQLRVEAGARDVWRRESEGRVKA